MSHPDDRSLRDRVHAAYPTAGHRTAPGATVPPRPTEPPPSPPATGTPDDTARRALKQELHSAITGALTAHQRAELAHQERELVAHVRLRCLDLAVNNPGRLPAANTAVEQIALANRYVAYVLGEETDRG